MGRLLVLFIFFAAIAFIAYQLYNFFVSINNSSGQRRRDLDRLKVQMREMVKELIPMNHTEMELLSVNQSGVSKSRGMNGVETGAFISVYHEPLLAYAYKQYSYPADQSILLVSSASDNFVYMTKGGSTQVFHNDLPLGLIDSEGNMYDEKTNRKMARIEADQMLSSHPVRIEGREVGEIVNARLNESPNPRAYQFLEPMNEKEARLFKALTFLSLVEESV